MPILEAADRPTHSVNSPNHTQVVRRTLLDAGALTVGHVTARPVSAGCGDVERQSVNVLVFPLAGVFAKHEGRGRHFVATANHAILIAAESAYRISYPGAIGDQCLTIRFDNAALAQALARVAPRHRVRDAAVGTQALLSPSIMLARSLLWRRLACADVADAVEAEESSARLLLSTLAVLCAGGARDASADTTRRSPAVERVKEAVAVQPERKWTLGELAALASVSPYHLAHVFKQEVGVPIYRYILRARLAKALNAMLDGQEDLTAVAMEAGFASHSHFTARFREFFGRTPTELRRGVSRRHAAELRKIVTAGLPAVR